MIEPSKQGVKILWRVQLCGFATIWAEAKEREGMAFNREIGLLADRCELVRGQANFDFDHAVTASAGQVMVMTASADAIVMCAVGKFNAVQQPLRNQHFHGSIDRCAAQARLFLAQRLPEVIDGEVGSAFGQRDQLFRNDAPRACIALAHLLECRADFLCYHDFLASFLQSLSIEIVYHIVMRASNFLRQLF
jgi:hypothetical protein